MTAMKVTRMMMTTTSITVIGALTALSPPAAPPVPPAPLVSPVSAELVLATSRDANGDGGGCGGEGGGSASESGTGESGGGEVGGEGGCRRTTKSTETLDTSFTFTPSILDKTAGDVEVSVYDPDAAALDVVYAMRVSTTTLPG